MAKLLPEAINSSHYRFPAQGQSYIQVPHEAFRSQGECSCRARPGARAGGPPVLSPSDVLPAVTWRATALRPARLFLRSGPALLRVWREAPETLTQNADSQCPPAS